MLQVKNLTKIYGANKVLDNINIDLKPNKIYGVFGRNGAGKTTLVNIITNRVFGTNGNIEIDGGFNYENDKVQEKVFCITEKSTYPPIEKVNALFKWASRFYPSFDMDYAIYLAKCFDVELDKKLGKLSTGYTTIVKDILTLASNVPYMIFDEPVLGIDAIYREIFYEELRKTHKKLKNTIIICSHILDEAETIIDDVIILKKGQIAFNGAVGEITEKKSLQDFYLEIHKKDEKPKAQEKQIESSILKSKSKVDFKKVKNSARYLFNISWLHASIILALISIFTILPLFIKNIQFGIEITLLINLFIIAMTLHGYFFRYALYNGVSRRSYFIAINIMLLSYATFFSLLASISILILHFCSDIQIMMKGIYPELFTSFNFIDFITIFGWLLFLNILFMMLALFSMVLYQTLTRKGRYIAMTILVVIFLGFTLWGTLDLASLANVFMFLFGLKYNLGAWFADIWFLILGLIFSSISWLILRRTEIK